MNLFLKYATAALLTLLPLIATAGQATIERAQRGIPAPLIDHGDYFYHPDGRRLNFYRKQGLYAIQQQPLATRTKAIPLSDRIQAQFGDRAKIVRGHALGATTVVKLDDSLRSKIGAPVTPQMIKSLDSSITATSPVLANARGNGDLLITNRLLIKLEQGQGAESLESILKQYNLSLDRRVRTSGLVYSVSATQGLTTTARFGLARRVMSDERIAWAQPQFKTRPYKTAYQPTTNPLYIEQWHLQNTGKGGSRCDTDCDANNAWGIGVANGSEGATSLSGSGMVIAIIDDGVQLDHEDLAIWVNPNEVANNGLDDDNNGYDDDVNGWDFVDDDSSQTGSCGEDATRGEDNDPSPQPFTACTTADGDPVIQDNHGTAVAGIAAAQNNSLGVVGSAYSATILPIRLISAFDADPDSNFCTRAIEALTYAGTYAHVINSSWAMEQGTCPGLDTVIEQIVDGTLGDLNGEVTPVRAGLGSPVVFGAGNNASGWVKVTVPVTAGKHAYEWRFLRADFPVDDFVEDDIVRLDDITYPDGSTESFEAGLGEFTNACAVNTCIGCTQADTQPEGCKLWEINTNPDFSRSGSSAQIDMLNRQCIYSYLNIIKDGPAGTVSFWVWASTDQQVFSDKFEFLIDGKEVTSFGDLANLVDDAVAYPANVLKTIAVGASDAGDLSGIGTADLSAEERVFYSQFGPSLDVLAPSGNQHLGIVTTDRYGPNGEGFNSNQDIGGSAAADLAYTDDFGGTSASAAIVSGVAAAMIASDTNITAAEVEATLRATADKIGRRGSAAYDQDGNTRSNFYGYGRVNMFEALKSVLEVSDADSDSCTPEPFNYSFANDRLLPDFAPQPTEFCSAVGPLAPDESACFPIKSPNGKVAVFCL